MRNLHVTLVATVNARLGDAYHVSVVGIGHASGRVSGTTRWCPQSARAVVLSVTPLQDQQSNLASRAPLEAVSRDDAARESRIAVTTAIAAPPVIALPLVRTPDPNPPSPRIHSCLQFLLSPSILLKPRQLLPLILAKRSVRLVPVMVYLVKHLRIGNGSVVL